jgi:hypothetical protein
VKKKEVSKWRDKNGKKVNFWSGSQGGTERHLSNLKEPEKNKRSLGSGRRCQMGMVWLQKKLKRVKISGGGIGYLCRLGTEHTATLAASEGAPTEPLLWLRQLSKCLKHMKKVNPKNVRRWQVT